MSVGLDVRVFGNGAINTQCSDVVLNNQLLHFLHCHRLELELYSLDSSAFKLFPFYNMVGDGFRWFFSVQGSSAGRTWLIWFYHRTLCGTWPTASTSCLVNQRSKAGPQTPCWQSWKSLLVYIYIFYIYMSGLHVFISHFQRDQHYVYRVPFGEIS